MAYTINSPILRDKNKPLSERERYAFSILSDAQEEIDIGNNQKAIEMINNAKRVLMGRYTIKENGLFIEIHKGKNSIEKEKE